MIYAIAGLNILGILPVESLPSRASLREPQDLTTGSNDRVERSILIEKTERHAAQAPALRERYHKSSIFNSGLPGLGVRQKLLFDGIRAFLNLIDQVLFVQRICQL
jgi:hypothetical protein